MHQGILADVRPRIWPDCQHPYRRSYPRSSLSHPRCPLGSVWGTTPRDNRVFSLFVPRLQPLTVADFLS